MRRWRTWGVVLVLLCVRCAADVLDNEVGDINNLELQTTSSEVKKRWGLADSVAIVGKLFTYRIPGDAFTGNVQRYEVTEAGRSSLPNWLHFNISISSLEGVPSEANIGQAYITVTAIGPKTSDQISSAKDVFSVDVLPDSRDVSRYVLPDSAASSGGMSKCDAAEDVTLFFLLLDADLEHLNALHRVDIVKKLTKLLQVAQDVRLAAHQKEVPLVTDAAIMAGPGNVKKKLNSGVTLQFQVGCSGSVDKFHSSVLAALQSGSRDGTLSELLSLPVLGWHVSTQKSQPPTPSTPRREKRHVIYGGHATPVPSAVPTYRPTHTHHHYNNELDSDPLEPGDEFDEDEYNEGVPDARIIPTMSSPQFPGATWYPEEDRHPKHRTKTHGRHMHRNHNPNQEQEATAVPPSGQTQRQNPRKSKPAGVIGTPAPTPVVDLTRPTRIRTRTKSRTHTEPIDGLQTSFTFIQPTPVLTMPLPTHTFEDSDEDFAPPPSIFPSRTGTPPLSVPTLLSGRNTPPSIRNRMKRLAWYPGKVYRHAIPANTFQDQEEGNTRKLKLMLLSQEGTNLPASSWVQFDPVKQELYGLPLEEHIGKWEFIIEAMDNSGESVRETFEILIRQHQISRAVHHEFAIQLRYDKWRFTFDIDWQIRFVDKLLAFYADHNNDTVTVRHIKTDPLVLTWTNDTLPRHPCPDEEIQLILRMMAVDSEGTTITRRFRSALQPEFKISRVQLTLLNNCQPKMSPTATAQVNMKPTERNQIDQINATLGEFLHFKIPHDTFGDEEDGNTRNLKLSFLTIDGLMMTRSSWIQFDVMSQELIGLPLQEDARRQEYQLVAMDKEGLSVVDALVIVVQPRPFHQRSNVEFSIHIDYDYYSFSNDLTTKVKVLDKLVHLYGDPDPRYITVKSITPGSVVFAWSNNSLPYNPCPRKEIYNLVTFLMNENRTVSRKLADAFMPEFNVTKADVMVMGVCQGDLTPTRIAVVPPPPSGEPDHKPMDDHLLLTTIIPAIVIAIMLLLAALIACFLYRKKRKGKMVMEEKSNFINKGIPVIFADELEEKPDPARSPVIMKDEKPPLPPPLYPRGGGGGPNSPPTPPLDRRELVPLRQDEMMMMGDQQSSETPPYHPPPPFTTNRDNRMNRPKHTTPTYRLPPPYVPP